MFLYNFHFHNEDRQTITNPDTDTLDILYNLDTHPVLAVDFNTGNIIDGTSTIEDCGEKLLNFVLEVASGRVKVCARKLGQNDFIPWKRGMSL